MIDLSDPMILVGLVSLCAAETAALLAFIVLAQPSQPPAPRPDAAEAPAAPRPPLGRSGTTRRVGFISRYGVGLAGLMCFGILFALTWVSTLPGGVIVSVVGWWVAALCLFGLTVRQTLKANILLGLLNIAILMGIATAMRH